jgi:hypothetical protein
VSEIHPVSRQTIASRKNRPSQRQSGPSKTILVTEDFSCGPDGMDTAIRQNEDAVAKPGDVFHTVRNQNQP